MKITINEENFGYRIDRFLKEEVFFDGKITRGEIVKNIKIGHVLVNEKKIKPSYILKTGDELEINLEEKQEKIIPSREITFEEIYADKNFVIISKPAGLKVHPVNFEETDTLANQLAKKFPEIISVGDNPLRPGIVHRLDKDTSGIMIIARNQKTFEELKNKFQKHEMEKKYLALVFGHLENKKGRIEKALTRSANYKKQKIADGRGKNKSRTAITEYEVLENLKEFDLVEATPKTGRTHQIRVHLASLGHSIVGDAKYKRKNTPEMENAKRQMLHAQSLKFELFGKTHEFQAKIPQDFQDLLSESRVIDENAKDR